MTPSLSICIATLNRAAFLAATLDALIPQASEAVEIVVVDGASTDSTETVVRERQKRFAGLRYDRLAQKGGVDQDYCHAVALARGEYCWLMADDDLLKPGGLAAVLTAMRCRYSLIVVNAEVRADELATQVVPRLLPFAADREYLPDERDRLLLEVGQYLSFIGSVVIRREEWETRDKAAYFGTEFVHVGVIFQRPLTSKALVLAEPWIIIRHGQASWLRRYFEIWAIKWPGLIESLPDISAGVKRQVCASEAWRRPKVLLVLRAKGAYTLEHYRRFVAPRLVRARERWLAWLIAAWPGVLINLVVYFYFRLFHPHQLFGLREFQDSPYFYKNRLKSWRPAAGHSRSTQL